MIVRETRELNAESSAQRSNEEVILILGAELSWMGEPVDVDLIVARSTRKRARRLSELVFHKLLAALDAAP
jgi:hypothetical protein